MEDRLSAKGQPVVGHAVELDPRARRSKRPRLVGDDCSYEAAAPLREQAVALNEEVLERPRPGRLRPATRLVAGCETGLAPAAEVVDTAAVDEGRHACELAIARTGGFNQALIFYHFGSLDGLLLAALDKTSEERLRRYRAAVAKAATAEELAEVAARVYKEDRDRGHMTVVSQMVAGSVARPELAKELVARMEPWIELCEEALTKALSPVPIAQAVPLRELAYAVVTFYLGLNLVTHLDEDRERTEALVARLQGLAPLLASARS